MDISQERNESTNIIELIGAAQKVIEYAENTKEEVSNLEQKISDNKTILVTLKNAGDNLQNLISENVAEIENCQRLTKELNDCNVKFISEAQMIYNSGLELDKVLEPESENFEKVTSINKEKEPFKLMIEKYNFKKEKLLNEIEVEKMINLEIKEKNKKITDETLDLKKELDEINKEILLFEEKINVINQSQFDTDISELKEKIVNTDNEIIDKNKILNGLEEEQSMKAEIISKTIQESYPKIEELEQSLNNKMSDLQKLLLEEEEANNEVLRLEASNKTENEKIITLINKPDELKKKIEEVEGIFNNEIECSKETINKLKTNLKVEEGLEEKLTLDIETGRTDIKILEFDIESLKDILTEFEKKLKSDNSFEVNEGILKLDSKLQDLNDEKTRRLSEKQQDLENEIKDMENHKDKTELDNETIKNDIKKLKNKIEEIEKKKIELQEKLQETVVFHNPEVPKKRIRHWDSDTTVEDEDTTYAEKVMRRIKINNKNKKSK